MPERPNLLYILSDQHTQKIAGCYGDPVAQTRLMRTQPLWGARFNVAFLHDGRATTIEEAILAHDGQAAAARNAFNALSRRSKDFLITFVNSL